MKQWLFWSARMKLTVLFLVIVMFISAAFSLFFYRAATIVIAQRLHIAITRWQTHMGRQLPVQVWNPQKELVEAQKIIRNRLILANGVILLLAGSAGYYFAGQALKPISQAVERQKRFVADASHDLKTPLTVMRATLELALEEPDLSAREQETYTSLMEEVEGLQNLVTALLSLAQVESGGQVDSYQVVNLVTIVQKNIKKFLPVAKQKKIKLTANLPKQAEVLAEPGLLEKLVQLLLDNALRYTEAQGKVSVNLTVKPKGIELVVSDTGKGIPQSLQHKVFQRFYRIDQARTRGSGHGLGLAMACEIVERYHGKIKVHSQTGQGTSMIVWLPRRIG